MLRFILSVLLLIGVGQSSLVRRDILDDANDAIAQVEAQAKEFKQMTENVETEIEKIIKEFGELTKPVLEEFQSHLSNSIGFLEDKITGLVNSDVAEKTCGIINIRKHAKISFHSARDCSRKVTDGIITKIREITQDTTKIADEFINIRENIENCKKLDSNVIKKHCIEQAKEAANNIITKFKITVLSVKSVGQVLKMPADFQVCLAKEGTNTLMNEMDNVISCLSEKLPVFGEISNQIEKATQFFQNDVIATVDKLTYAVKNEINKIETPLKNIADGLVQKMENFSHLINDIGKQTLGTLEQLGGKFIEYACKLCAFCFMCPLCPKCS